VKIEYEQTTPTAIVRVLEDDVRRCVQIEYRHEVYPDNRTTYPQYFEGAIFFLLPERLTDEIHEAVYAAFEYLLAKA